MSDRDDDLCSGGRSHGSLGDERVGSRGGRAGGGSIPGRPRAVRAAVGRTSVGRLEGGGLAMFYGQYVMSCPRMIDTRQSES